MIRKMNSTCGAQVDSIRSGEKPAAEVIKKFWGSFLELPSKRLPLPVQLLPAQVRPTRTRSDRLPPTAVHVKFVTYPVPCFVIMKMA